MYERYPVITLCGSTRYEYEFRLIAKVLSLSGAIIISPETFSHSKNTTQDIVITSAMMNRIVDMHWQKIDMADAICVIHPSYQGEATKNEIEYAKDHNKFIMMIDLEKNPIEGVLSSYGYEKLNTVFLDALRLLRKD